jgi:hypothetical protein
VAGAVEVVVASAPAGEAERLTDASSAEAIVVMLTANGSTHKLVHSLFLIFVTPEHYTPNDS